MVCVAQCIVSYRKVVASSETDNKIKLSIKFHLTLSLNNLFLSWNNVLVT